MPSIRNRHTGEMILEFAEHDPSRMEIYKAVLDEEQLKEVTSYLELTSVDLSNNNLASADLVNANLYRTNLMDCCLDDTDLEGAFLFGADLSGASLIGANLKDAALHYTVFTEADLTGAILTGAKFSTKTVFPDGYDPVAHGAVDIDMSQFPVRRKPETAEETIDREVSAG